MFSHRESSRGLEKTVGSASHLLVNVTISDLQEPAGYCTHEADPRAEGHTSCTYWSKKRGNEGKMWG